MPSMLPFIIIPNPDGAEGMHCDMCSEEGRPVCLLVRHLQVGGSYTKGDAWCHTCWTTRRCELCGTEMGDDSGFVCSCCEDNALEREEANAVYPDWEE